MPVLCAAVKVLLLKQASAPNSTELHSVS